MEYVILVVGLAAVGAAWDGARRAIESSSSKHVSGQEQSELERRLSHLERAQLVTRNHLVELKGFVASGLRKQR
jgi:hypothetical protein